MFFIITMLEFGVAGFIIWGLFNEDKLVAFEDRIFAKIKKSIRRRKANVYHRKSHITENKYCA